MTANFNPIYSIAPSVSNNAGTGMNQLVTAAANDYTGISVNNSLAFTAGANGSFIQRLRFKATGTNTASVARIYINNGSVNTTATNNEFYGEISLPGTAAIITAATVEIDYPMNFGIDPNFRIFWGLGTAVLGGWVCIGIAGIY